MFLVSPSLCFHSIGRSLSWFLLALKDSPSGRWAMVGKHDWISGTRGVSRSTVRQGMLACVVYKKKEYCRCPFSAEHPREYKNLEQHFFVWREKSIKFLFISLLY